MLSSANDPFFIFMVFGSYAKGTQTSKSDIDILIITKSKEQIKDVEASIKKIYTKVKKNIIIVAANDFLEMVSNPDELNVGNEAKKHHILLYGVEPYYQLIRRF